MKIAREFTVAESAKRGAEREQFNAMVAWVKKQARKEGITHILAHKLDRVCRNMRDAVRMQELEDQCGVKLMFVDNQFGPGAAGALSFNVMAAVAQYYSDNLRTEVLKGMNEKARQGWLPGHSPFGYRNVTGNKEEPIQVDPEDGPTVQRIFELYSRGNTTFKEVADTLAAEGRRHSKSQVRFGPTTISYILNNPFYIGELEWQGQRQPGRHRPLVERTVFNICQDIMNGRNRRTGTPNIPYNGGVFRCGICGKAMVGEQIKKKLRDGRCNLHYYYKCHGALRDGHANIRWKQEALEAEVVRDLERMKLEGDAAAWVRETLEGRFRDEEGIRREQRGRWQKRLSEVKGMLERLLSAYLNGAIDESTFKEKSLEFKAEEAELAEQLAGYGGGNWGEVGKQALAAFDFSQQAVKLWYGSTFEARRAILDCLWSNRVLTDVNLCLIRRKPFDVLVEGLLFKNGGRYWTRTSDPYNVSVVRYRLR